MQAEKQHDKWFIIGYRVNFIEVFVGADFQHAMLIFSSFIS